MKSNTFLTSALFCAALVFSTPTLAMQKCGGEIHFASGKSSTDLTGEVAGYDFCTYTFYAKKGQQLITYFNKNDKPQAVLYSPVNEILADNQAFTLPQSGKYELRVLMTRNDARKHSKPQPFTLHFAIDGSSHTKPVQTKPVQAKNTEIDTQAERAAQSGFAGVYQATLPCPSCGGIDTKLTLNKDGTYTLNENYIGRGQFSQQGNWLVYGNSIVLQPEGKEDSAYLIAKDGDVYFTTQQEAGAETPKVQSSYRLKHQ